MRWIACLPVVAILFLTSCKNDVSVAGNTDTAMIDGHPAWIMNSNVYEVNVRQYTPEGTFKAFEKHLDRLKAMGVQTLWFMPINPISKTERKGSLGSYYAVADYTAINPEFGNMDDWKSLVKKCHDMGFKVIIDWVANHTGADHYWLTKHPGFYVRDSTGKAVSQFDWTDTRKLNFNNEELKDSIISQMKGWITGTGIDGFRCDYAVGPSKSFWKKCITELRKVKNVFMLAEADSTWLYEAGFDATYAWSDFNMMKLIAAGKRKVTALDSVLKAADTTLPKNGLRFYFTSNHDENSWNKADFATMPGASHAPFAVLTQTMARSVPMIYSGQEVPVLRALSFFEKDTIRFSKFARAWFYKKLLLLRKSNPALSANAPFVRVHTGNDDAVYAYYRKLGKHFVLVILNLTSQPQRVNLAADELAPIATAAVDDVMAGRSMHGLPAGQMQLEPWAYLVLANQPMDQ